MEVATNSQVAVIEKSMEVFQNAPAILLKHQARASKALLVADQIITQWTDAFAIQDPEERILALAKADERSMKFLANCTEASTQMKESRAAITQLMDMLRKMYTAEENSLDPKTGEKPAAIQANRNKYAKAVLEEQERQRKIAESKAAKEREANEIRAFITGTISRKLFEFLAQRKTFYVESFNTISLTDFEERSAKLIALNTACPENKIAEVIRYDLPRATRHDDIEINTLRIKTHESFDFKAFYARYANEITELKQSLIDRLPSKKAELLEAKRVADQAEKERLELIEKQRREQIQRDKEIAKANAQKKIELEAANKKAQELHEKAMKDLADKAAADMIEAARLKAQREQEERDKLAKEAEENRIKAEQEAELKKSADDAMAMFNQVADVANNATSPEVRTGIVITVTHAAAWVELMEFWFRRECSKVPLEDMEKMTFEKLRKYAEKAAGKGDKIESKFMNYGSSVTAVNRKAK